MGSEICDLKHHRCHCLEYEGQVPGGQSIKCWLEQWKDMSRVFYRRPQIHVPWTVTADRLHEALQYFLVKYTQGASREFQVSHTTAERFVHHNVKLHVHKT